MDWLLQDLSYLLGVIAEEAQHLVSIDWYRQNFVPLLNIIMIDLVLAGDNAIIVGLAASRVPREIRSRVIFWGIAAAVVLRIFFAAITVQLLAIIGLTLAGGILLLWVCWKMYLQITTGSHHSDVEPGANNHADGQELGFWQAVGLITVADVSMSLDNVLAVAGAAKGSTLVLVIGLAVAIILMAVASHYIAALLVKYPWITWIGLLIILWVALGMIYQGSHEVTCNAFNFGCSETLWQGIKHRLGFG
ncbi:TerC family protein [Hyphomicrobium sp. NDB2Meth4]|uniref:TerC family protein n=1 Tax=Hyphomicrobium sp. NDB2Meth4 TaxID=1892846 RepID=UPI000931FCBD|nr:TerC family protein [Hyphomicrobium sp. NDB2Meth4]